MGRRYFGTDGVRGRVGEHPMTVDFALKLASAAARVLAPQGGTVLIGKDTRLSGYMPDRTTADARHRLHDAAFHLRLRRGDQRLAQSL